MAKVRIQAGAEPFNDSEKDKSKEHSLLPPPAASAPTHAHHHHVHHKHAGAINILHHVLRTQGFFGWYQVRHIFPYFHFLRSGDSINSKSYIGYGRSNHESRPLTSHPVHVERETGALGTSYHGALVESETWTRTHFCCMNLIRSMCACSLLRITTHNQTHVRCLSFYEWHSVHLCVWLCMACRFLDC